MNNKVFPPEIKRYISVPGVKAAFVSDISPVNPHDCTNCGGAQVFALFVATKGPFQAPAAPYAKDGETSHFDPTAGKLGGWWVGKTFTFPCPVCLGGQKPVEVAIPQPRQAAFMAATGERLE